MEVCKGLKAESSKAGCGVFIYFSENSLEYDCQIIMNLVCQYTTYFLNSRKWAHQRPNESSSAFWQFYKLSILGFFLLIICWIWLFVVLEVHCITSFVGLIPTPDLSNHWREVGQGSVYISYDFDNPVVLWRDWEYDLEDCSSQQWSGIRIYGILHTSHSFIFYLLPFVSSNSSINFWVPW